MRISAAAAATALGVLALAGCSGSVPTAEVGDCLTLDMNAAEFTELPTTDCANSHTSEVYAKGASTQSSYDYLAVDQEAQDLCLAEFEPYIGQPYETSSLYVTYITPTTQTWAKGDRELLCLVYEVDDSLNPVNTTGSLKGSGK